MATLREPLNLNKLVSEGIDFCVDVKDVRDNEDDFREEYISDEDQDEPESWTNRQFQNLNKECTGIFDEDTYEDAGPFEVIGKKMFNLLPDGKIKKRIIREGNGETPIDYASVKVHYNAYVEHNDEPFDSTYVRKRPRSFIINDGRVIPGLDFGVQSMKLGEKSQFLIHPDYAFGKISFIGRVPSDATVLFEVELLEIVNSGAVLTYERLTEEDQKLFSEIYKYCMALCEKGKQLFLDHDYKKAIRDYNTAACALEKADLGNREEIEKHRELSLRIYTNLLISYTRNNEPKKACKNAQKIYTLTQNGELMKISAKVYFNHAKCLRILGDYANAKSILDKAYRLEPRNPEIANEVLNLDNDRVEYRKTQELLARALVGKVEK